MTHPGDSARPEPTLNSAPRQGRLWLALAPLLAAGVFALLGVGIFTALGGRGKAPTRTLSTQRLPAASAMDEGNPEPAAPRARLKKTHRKDAALISPDYPPDSGEDDDAGTPAEREERARLETLQAEEFEKRAQRIEHTRARFEERSQLFEQELKEGKVDAPRTERLRSLLQTEGLTGLNLDVKKEVRCTQSVCELTFESEANLGKTLASISPTLKGLPADAALDANAGAGELTTTQSGEVTDSGQDSRIRILLGPEEFAEQEIE